VSSKKTSKPLNLWAYKVGAIIAAVLIWVMVIISQNQLNEKIFMVSLELRSLPQGLIMEKSINQVQVRVQGTDTAINQLTAADISAYVDLAGFKAGQYELEVLVDHPSNVQVLSLRPESITVELKETQTQTFPLEADVLGEPAAGYRHLDPVVAPTEIKLIGAEDDIRRVAKVFVAASIQDIEASYEQYHSVMVLDVAGNDISDKFTIEPSVAKVVVPVIDEQPERMVAVRVPITGQPALGYQLSLISAVPSVVHVYGDLQRLQSLLYVDTEPVDVSDLKANASRTVRLVTPNGFEIYPTEVTVAIQIEPVNSVTIDKNLILMQNIPDGYSAEVEKLDLSITVFGPETFIASLDEADIVPYVDCAGLAAGNYELPIRVSLPPNIALMSISQDTAAVTLLAPEGGAPGEGTPEESAPDGGAQDGGTPENPASPDNSTAGAGQ